MHLFSKINSEFTSIIFACPLNSAIDDKQH